MKNNLQTIDLVIRLFVLGFVIAWCSVILRPFVALVLWAAILAIGLFPIFSWLRTRLGGRNKLAAIVITIIGLAIIIGPVSLIATISASNVQTFADKVSEGTLVIPPPPESIASLPLIGESLNSYWQEASVNLDNVISQFKPQLQELTKFLLVLAANTGLNILKFILSMIIAAGFLINAEGIKVGLTHFVTRLNPNQGENFIQLAATTIRNVTRGVIGISLLQTLLVGIGLTVAGIPGAGVLTVICLFLTIIQVGPGIVVLPTLIFAWSSMNTFAALLFTVWMIVATLIDNILKPILMASGLPVPMLVILMGVLGGTLVHGIVGLFVGPVILSLGYELTKAWINDNSDSRSIKTDVDSELTTK